MDQTLHYYKGDNNFFLKVVPHAIYGIQMIWMAYSCLTATTTVVHDTDKVLYSRYDETL